MNTPFTFEPEQFQHDARCSCPMCRERSVVASEEEFGRGGRLPRHSTSPQRLGDTPRLAGRHRRPPLGRPGKPGGRVPPSRIVASRVPWAVVREPYPVVREPDGVEPELSAGSEYVRWVQNCLNKILGLRLPLSGVIGPETRSAIRSFQKQQGLPVTGLMNPDTEAALQSACGGPSPQMDGTEEILGEVVTLGPITATLRWLPDLKNPSLYSHPDAMRMPGGGVYIAVNKTNDELLKVGETGNFNSRFRKKDYKDMAEEKGMNLQFYLAYIMNARRGACGVAGCQEPIERAIARTLRRTGATLLRDKKPAGPTEVVDSVKITNILPKPLMEKLRRAYLATVQHEKKTRLLGGPFPPISRSLILDPKTHQVWELKITEEPFNF